MTNLADYDKKRLTITCWAHGGTDRVGELHHRPSPGNESLCLDIQIDLNHPRFLDPFITLTEAQVRHIKPDRDGYTMRYSEFHDSLN